MVSRTVPGLWPKMVKSSEKALPLTGNAKRETRENEIASFFTHGGSVAVHVDDWPFLLKVIAF